MMRLGACQSLSIVFCCCCFLLLLYHLKISFFGLQFSSVVQPLSHVRLFVTPWTAACQASLSIINSWSLLKLMSIKPVMPSSCLIPCHPPLLLPSIFPSFRVFSPTNLRSSSFSVISFCLFIQFMGFPRQEY